MWEDDEQDGKIPPKAEISVKETDINLNEQYSSEVMKKCGEILTGTAPNKENENMCNRSRNFTWPANSVNCVSKSSKAVKKELKTQ